MGGVSDTGPNGSADTHLIMDGGANWMARMTAFLQAKEEAQAAIDKAGIVGDIASVRDEARADREAAQKELADARASADTLVSYTKTQADVLMAKAKADAEKIMGDAKAMLEDATARAGATLETAAKKMAEADSLMALAVKRKADLDAVSEGLTKRAETLASAQTDAETAKAHFDDLTSKLKDFLAQLAGE